MSDFAFQRTPLAVAVCTAVLSAPAGAASLLDDAAPAVALYAAADGYELVDFDVAALPDGRFAVLWHETNSDSRDSIKLARFNAGGDPLGNVMLGDVVTLDDGNTGSIDVRDPAIAADSDGNLVVAWGLTVGDDCGNLYHSRIAGDGTVTTDRQALLSPNGGSNCRPDVAMNAEGQFVLGWYNQLPEWPSEHVVQAFNADGTAIGPSFSVGSATYDDAPALALQGDTFLVARAEQVVDPRVIIGRRYNLNGTALEEDDFRLDDGSEAGTSLKQRLPAVAADQDGGFLALWAQEVWEDGAPILSVQGRHRAADGTSGEALPVYSGDAFTGGPSLATDGAGLILVGWSQAPAEVDGVLSRVAAFQDGAPLGDGAVTLATSTVPEAVAHSEHTEVVLRDGTATAVWFDQKVDGPSTLRARSLTLSDGSVEPGPADEGGSSGGGGTTGLLTLLGLGLLARRRRVRR
ncbi:MAG: MYXO-CTERM domain-containing protein [Alloalcanivorax sp.]